MHGLTFSCPLDPLYPSLVNLCYTMPFRGDVCYIEGTMMAAKDIFHHAVRSALIKDQWIITNDPLTLQVDGVDFYIDLGAEKLIAAEREGQRIAVEVKSFLGPSIVSDFHVALGQCLNYRLALESYDATRKLYLAVPIDTYSTFFSLLFVQRSIQRYQLALLVYDPEPQEVVQWIP